MVKVSYGSWFPYIGFGIFDHGLQAVRTIPRIVYAGFRSSDEHMALMHTANRRWDSVMPIHEAASCQWRH